MIARLFWTAAALAAGPAAVAATSMPVDRVAAETPAGRVMTATPGTLDGIIAGARGGETVRLAPGDYPLVAISARRFSPPLVIDASDARVSGLRLNDVAGLTWRGGTMRARDPFGRGKEAYGIFIGKSQHVEISGVTVNDSQRAIVIAESNDVLISKNRLLGMTIDGVDIGSGSSFITVDGNYCETLNTGEAHPDCYQGWSRAGRPVSDIVITNNVARGRVQGIFFGNHLERVPPDPGFDRVRIEHNVVEVLYPQGIGMSDCRDCKIRFNKVSTLPGARFRANLRYARIDGPVCGNIVRDVPGRPNSAPC